MYTGTRLMPDPASQQTERSWQIKTHQVAKSHAHAARKHQEHALSKVRKLLKSTPGDVKINFVKSEVFGVENGDPIIDAKHPVMVEMFSQPIVGAMRSFLSFRR